VLDRLLRAGYYQILTYGKGENWYAYWDMYQQPQTLPTLSVGLDYWWSILKKRKRLQIICADNKSSKDAKGTKTWAPILLSDFYSLFRPYF
jgi:hypothetical protein